MVVNRIESAYIEIPMGNNFHWGQDEPSQGARFNSKTPEGLDVTWVEDPPPGYQLYLYWDPKVVAIWEKEAENNGEDGNSEDGSEDGAGGEANPQEPDPELGLPGSGNAGE